MENSRVRRFIPLGLGLLLIVLAFLYQSVGRTVLAPGAEQSADTAPVRYADERYGFDFTLPDSWRGYSVIVEEWVGYAQGEAGQEPAARGPLLLLRHPHWTAQVPRQDIPIMAFTPSEWDAIEQDRLHVGAAPVPPRELGRNARYVFALPARYNYAFPAGYEEVENILAGQPLRAF